MSSIAERRKFFVFGWALWLARKWWAGTYRVVRGGSWINNDPRNLRSCNRNNNDPDNRNNNVGFRVVLVGKFLKAAQERNGVMPGGNLSFRTGAKKPSLTPFTTPRILGGKTRRRIVVGNGSR